MILHLAGFEPPAYSSEPGVLSTAPRLHKKKRHFVRINNHLPYSIAPKHAAICPRSAPKHAGSSSSLVLFGGKSVTRFYWFKNNNVLFFSSKNIIILRVHQCDLCCFSFAEQWFPDCNFIQWISSRVLVGISFMVFMICFLFLSKYWVFSSSFHVVIIIICFAKHTPCSISGCSILSWCFVFLKIYDTHALIALRAGLDVFHWNI